MESKVLKVSYLFPDYLMEVRLEKEGGGKKERKTLNYFAICFYLNQSLICCHNRLRGFVTKCNEFSVSQSQGLKLGFTVGMHYIQL